MAAAVIVNPGAVIMVYAPETSSMCITIGTTDLGVVMYAEVIDCCMSVIDNPGEGFVGPQTATANCAAGAVFPENKEIAAAGSVTFTDLTMTLTDPYHAGMIIQTSGWITQMSGYASAPVLIVMSSRG